MLKRVAESIIRYSMFAPGQSVGVAVSGGADSTAMLHALAEMAPEWCWRLVVLHLNHNLRGAESDEDARLVERMAASLGLGCISTRCDVGRVDGNLEEAGRRARQAFFRRAMQSEKLDRVAVGHTRNDQAETVLFRLLRGAGTTGLSGIWPVSPEGIVRPLIETSRHEVLKYLRERGIAWREDASNRDQRFARNRIRHTLLPELRQAWNPRLDVALAHMAAVCQDEERYWRGEVDRLIAETAERQGEALVFRVESLRQVAAAVLRRVVREGVSRVRNDDRPLEFGHVETLMELVRRQAGSGRAAVPGVSACRSFDWLRLSPAGARQPGYRLDLPVPGEVSLPGGGRLEVVIEPQPGDCKYNNKGVALDRERASGKLELRSWMPGVTFWPAGQSHAIKLKDLFQEARVPSWERAAWPMIRRGDTVIWVRRFGGAEGFVATESTRTALLVRELEHKDSEDAIRY